MADLVLHDINKELLQSLAKRAGINGRSAAEEHLAILKAALAIRNHGNFAKALMSMPNVGLDMDFERQN